ncbi:MAG: nitrous oxide reductase accessory protein NosL [Candidatus Kryptonium sp.]
MMKIIARILILVLLPVSLFSQSAMDILKSDLGKNLGICLACNMEVFEKMMTRTEIFMDDTVYHACGLGCAATIMQGKTVKEIKSVDFKTFKLIDAKKAWFVVGSVIIPVRAMLPAFSFSSKDDAENFAKIYGGRLFDYKGMIDFVKKISEERKKRK